MSTEAELRAALSRSETALRWTLENVKRCGWEPDGSGTGTLGADVSYALTDARAALALPTEEGRAVALLRRGLKPHASDKETQEFLRDARALLAELDVRDVLPPGAYVRPLEGK